MKLDKKYFAGKKTSPLFIVRIFDQTLENSSEMSLSVDFILLNGRKLIDYKHERLMPFYNSLRKSYYAESEVDEIAKNIINELNSWKLISKFSLIEELVDYESQTTLLDKIDVFESTSNGFVKYDTIVKPELSEKSNFLITQNLLANALLKADKVEIPRQEFENLLTNDTLKLEYVDIYNNDLEFYKYVLLDELAYVYTIEMKDFIRIAIKKFLKS